MNGPIYEVESEIKCEDCGTGYGETGPLVNVIDNREDFDSLSDLIVLCRECLTVRIDKLGEES